MSREGSRVRVNFVDIATTLLTATIQVKGLDVGGILALMKTLIYLAASLGFSCMACEPPPSSSDVEIAAAELFQDAPADIPAEHVAATLELLSIGTPRCYIHTNEDGTVVETCCSKTTCCHNTHEGVYSCNKRFKLRPARPEPLY